tara:strand:- start:180 stop:3653 length:3474 start_codon:yes stop_codon:yes gene_type:complete
MAAKKFKFISPGIYINEVDESILTPVPPILGPVIVGRTRKGPAMRPIRVESYAEFVEIFGDPVPGQEAGDMWRSYTPSGPTYAAYAAKAWLNAEVAPATIVRVLGEEHNARLDNGTLAGWKTTKGAKADLDMNYVGGAGDPHTSGSSVGGAFGMWVFDSGSVAEDSTDLLNGIHPGASGTLAAIWYCDSGSVMLMSGTTRDGTAEQTGSALFVKSVGTDNEFKTVLKSYSAGDDGTGIKAEATITIAAHVDVDGTIAITDHAGKTVTYTAKSTEDLAANQFDGDSGGDSAVAASLVSCINNAAGHNGTIIASTATVAAGQKITLTQNEAGTTGNTTITLDSLGANISKTDFSGGTYPNQQVFHFNFNESGGRYIRDVFNTNPVLTNSEVVSSAEVINKKNKYWLGETFDRQLKEGAGSSGSAGSQFGIIFPMLSGSVNWAFRQNSFVDAKTGWFFSQDFGENTAFSPDSTSTKLFRFVGRDLGQQGHEYKVAIEDIKASPNASTPFGSFTVAVYPITTYDTKAKFEALEKYTNCNLNPISKNYIARRIGDRHISWNYDLEKHTELGQFNNISNLIRIEMNPALDFDFNQASLPFGVTGPIRPKTLFWHSSSATADLTKFSSGSVFYDKYYGNANHGDGGIRGQGIANCATDGFKVESYITGGMIYGASGSVMESPLNTGANLCSMGSTDGIPFSGSFEFPAIAIRSSSLDGPGGGPGADAYFGASTTKSKTVSQPDAGATDYLRGMPFDSTVFGRFDELSGLPAGADNANEYSWVFSLDDIRINASNGAGEWVSGSRADGTSVSAVSSSYKKVLDYHDRFWTVMAGGHDGFDITEAEPLRNSQWTVGTTNQYNHYAWNSVHRALGTVADQDVIEYNLLTAPGITNDDLTARALEVVENRSDALAIIDLADVFQPSTEDTDSYLNNLGSVSSTLSSLKTRDLNTSYGCAYYPWVQIKDTKTRRMVWVPPSVVALGTMASSEASSELWFAPAGYKRGDLTAGSAGVPVVSASERLNQKQRDDLYLNNINPIATFADNSVVVFGQKTLQATPSALDRINVRRLMIYLKKEISRMSTEILFDNNVPATWKRFTNLVNPFLSSVRSRFGVSEFKVVLDESTTTADLIDRNIMYAKIYIKPAKAIEFIAIDFIVTKTGASFGD